MAYHSIASRHGSRLTASEVGSRFRRAFRKSETDRFPDGPASGSLWLSSDAIEIARWRWIVGEVVPDVNDLDQCFVELWDHFAQPASWSCFEEVGATLTSLRHQGFRLAIASNFDSRLHEVCNGHPALKSIEQRFVSSETGYRKPAPEFYSRVISQLGCAANEILMIGDDHEHDFVGPLAAGMQALLLERQPTIPSTNPTANSIGSLNELLSTIDHRSPAFI